MSSTMRLLSKCASVRPSSLRTRLSQRGQRAFELVVLDEVALRRLTFDSERQILEKALGVLRQRRAPASPQSEAV